MSGMGVWLTQAAIIHDNKVSLQKGIFMPAPYHEKFMSGRSAGRGRSDGSPCSRDRDILLLRWVWFFEYFPSMDAINRATFSCLHGIGLTVNFVPSSSEPSTDSSLLIRDGIK